MGSSASSSKSMTEKAAPRVAVLGMFMKHKRPSLGRESKTFLQEMKAKKMAALSAMDTPEESDSSSRVYRLRPPSGRGLQRSRSVDTEKDVISLVSI